MSRIMELSEEEDDFIDPRELRILIELKQKIEKVTLDLAGLRDLYQEMQKRFLESHPSAVSRRLPVFEGYRFVARTATTRTPLNQEVFVRHLGEEEGGELWDRFNEKVTIEVPPRPTQAHLKTILGTMHADKVQMLWTDESIVRSSRYLDIEEPELPKRKKSRKKESLSH